MKTTIRLAIIGCLVIAAIFGSNKLMEMRNTNVEVSKNDTITITNENFAEKAVTPKANKIAKLESDIINKQLDEAEKLLSEEEKINQLNNLEAAAGDNITDVAIETEAVSAVNKAIEEVIPAKTNNSGFDLTTATSERILGSDDAKVTIIEYASLTCKHCATFHTTTYNQLKKDYIDTGKVKYILRDFPLDGTALKASMMARCVDEDKYFNIMEVLFNSQRKWTTSPDPIQSLKQTSKLAGLSSEDFDKCIANKELENFLLTSMQSSQRKWDIKATPTFIFNDGADKFTGGQPYIEFQRTLNELLNK